MPKDKGSKLAKFLGQAIERLKGRRPHLNPKGQTKRSTEGPARERKNKIAAMLKTQRQVAKRQQPEPVADHRIDVYRNLVSILVEAKSTKPSRSKEDGAIAKWARKSNKSTGETPEQVAAAAKKERELQASNIRGRRIYGDQDESGSA